MQLTIGKAIELHKRLTEVASVVEDVMGAKDPDMQEMLNLLLNSIAIGRQDFWKKREYRDLKERYERQTRTPL